MNLEGIINVAGKPGLYKVVSQGNNTVIVESFTDGKKTPLYSHNQANMLEEIGIYTNSEFEDEVVNLVINPTESATPPQNENTEDLLV